MTLLFIAQTAWAQMEWREYPSMERGWHRDADVDFGYREPGEFVVGRLMFPQALKLREYLMRGGFLLCDSFYGTVEWEGFVRGMIRIFPDRPIVELPDTHPIFHSVYDLSDRPQIPTWQHLPRGYRNDGAEPHWRAILDEDNRVMVMITFNNDIADGWQRADEFYYPEEAANASIRLGVNFAVYALTH